MNKLIRITILSLFLFISNYGQALDYNSLMGQWSTYNQRFSYGIARHDLTFEEQYFTHSMTIDLLLPLFPKDTRTYKMTMKIASSTPHQEKGIFLEMLSHRTWLTLHTAKEIRLRNQLKYCGIDRWEVNEPMEVTGKTCVEDTNGEEPTPEDITTYMPGEKAKAFFSVDDRNRIYTNITIEPKNGDSQIGSEATDEVNPYLPFIKLN